MPSPGSRLHGLYRLDLGLYHVTSSPVISTVVLCAVPCCRASGHSCYVFVTLLESANVNQVGWIGLAPNPVGIQDARMSQIPIRVELVVIVTVVITGSRRARVLETAGVPIIMHRVVELAKVELRMIQILLGK
jgi:hypothetical protein